MTKRHTPGTWHAVGFVVETSRDDLADICTVDPRDFGQGQLFDADRAHANARLIAAAPDLLARLRDARDRLQDMLDGDDGQAWDEAEKALPLIDAAIAKATGK